MKKSIPGYLEIFFHKLDSNTKRSIIHKLRIWIQNFLFLFQNRRQDIILFLVEGTSILGGEEQITGGIVSIDSIYSETRKLANIHKASVSIATIKGLPILRFKKFDSNTQIFRLSQFLSGKTYNRVLIHVPEYLVPYFNKLIKENPQLIVFLKTIRKVHINVLNQNVELMPNEQELIFLKNYADVLTQTTAHKKYSDGKDLLRLGIDTFHFSTRLDPAHYNFVKPNKKEKLILFSPDNPSGNGKLEDILRTRLKGFTFRTIRGLTYNEYKKLIGRAMFCITLGEGLDGYFVETIFSGGITFTVNNSNFFTDEYLQLPIIYNSFASMEKDIADFMKKLIDDERLYTRTNLAAYEILAKIYNYKNYQRNIENFYRTHYFTAKKAETI